MRGTCTYLLLATLLCCHVYTQGAGNMVADCCLMTSTKSIPANQVSAYEIQTVEKGCREVAVVFITKTKPPRKLCAPLTSSWVIKLMKRLDRLKKINKKSKGPSSKPKE